MLNRISIMGRLTASPELRQLRDEAAVCTFDIACERDRKEVDGEKQVDFFKVIAWGRNAENIAKFFDKGRAIIIEGQLRQERWKDRDGNNRTTIKIMADKWHFADSKRTEENASFNGGYGGGHGGASYFPTVEMDVDEGSVPF